MTKLKKSLLTATIVAATGCFAVTGLMAQGRPPQMQAQPVDITIASSFDVAPADAQTKAMVDAANAFLNLLTDDQRAATVYAFDDNTQRANWSNFPDGMVQRGGLRQGDMTVQQQAALDDLLAAVMSDKGVENVKMQIAADDTLNDSDVPGAEFGSQNYYVSLLGEPSVDQPWMLQFGGHHLAINVTVSGADVTFSPMLTGGQPLRLTFDGQQVTIAEEEVQAAQTFLDSLNDTQKDAAVRSNRIANLMLGPGAYGTVVAPEGVKGSDLSDDQKALMVDVISARLGFINADDYAAVMETVNANLDDTYFGWWGPQGTLGAAYYRITAPTVIIEWSPQTLGGDTSNHSHAMYRDPTNDYGVQWISAQ